MTTGLTQDQLARLRQCFSRFAAIEKVILYGSRAKGTFKPGSDIDLTIVDAGLTDTDFLRLENELDDLLLPYKIDLSLKRHITNSDLLGHINRVGRVLYTRKASVNTQE